ncbi:MAG TPA: MBL fold metallo-hydrolase [Acidobacteriota bacterium]|nr:MBL fold metallo-hydrolase [Acidobacteriota bacterium]
MKWGSFQLHLLSAGVFRLDGGAMFGVVPKPLWERVATPDARNRIPLGLNCLLIRTGDVNVLVDTGCGRKYSPKEIEIYSIDVSADLVRELAKIGLDPEEIDIVVNTHLHFDHCGGNTFVAGEDVVPTFPGAEYVVRKVEYQDASAPNERTRATYFAHNWSPIEAAGKLRVIDQDWEIVPGVTCISTPGHTLGHQSVFVESEGRKLLFLADLCPTMAHVPLPYVMGYDLFPLTTLKTRKEIYPRAVEENWELIFEHDPVHPYGRLLKKNGRYAAERLQWAE